MAEKSSLSPPTPVSAEDVTGESVTSRKPAANPLLSCTNCRKRKVKCNKSNPCSACERSNLTCVFPNRARLPRGRTGGSKTTNVELLRRVNKLEDLLEKAVSSRKNDPAQPSAESSGRGRSDSALNFELGAAERPTNQKVEDDVLDRYIGSNFWKSLSHEVEGLRQTLNDVSDDDEDSLLPPESESSNSSSARSARILGIDLQNAKLRSLHPSPTQILMLCTFFIDNFDPIFKVMHVPTLKRSVLDASNSLDDMVGGKSMEALLFAMYYAAVTSLSSEACKQCFQEDQYTLLERYRTGTEIALANADILINADMTALQALVIFLLCVRCHDDSQYSWTLTSLAVRIAHSLNLHRENMDSSLPPFTQELRRRLWWQICILDIHAAEDRGSDPLIFEVNFNTKMPLNINDADLNPENPQPPSDKPFYTDMTFCRMAHEISMIARRLNYLPPSGGGPEFSCKMSSIEEKISVLENCQERVEKKFLVHCDLGYPIAWVASKVTRLILARMWLAICHPLQPEHRSDYHPVLTRDRVLAISAEILELAYALEREPSAAHWRWFFRSWVQWHALAVALAELCVRNNGTLVDRAWTVIDVVYEPWATHIADSRNGMLWRPISKLMTKAQANRSTSSSAGTFSSPKSTTSESMMSSPQQPPYIASVQPLKVAPPTTRADLGMDQTLQHMMMQHQIGQAPELSVSFHQQSLPLSPPIQTAQQTLPGFAPQQMLPVFPTFGTGENMDMINWAEWDEFMQDFETENGPGQVQEQVKPFGNLWLP